MLNIFEIVEKFELGNNERNKLVAVLIRNTPIYYSCGFYGYIIRTYGFEQYLTVKQIVDMIVKSTDVDVINICVKTLQKILEPTHRTNIKLSYRV